MGKIKKKPSSKSANSDSPGKNNKTKNKHNKQSKTSTSPPAKTRKIKKNSRENNEYKIGTISKIISKKQKIDKKGTDDDNGVTQFDPDFNLANLFSNKSINNTTTRNVFKTIIHHDKPVFQPITVNSNSQNNKKTDKLKNKDAAQIRIDAKRKFQSSSNNSINEVESDDDEPRKKKKPSRSGEVRVNEKTNSKNKKMLKKKVKSDDPEEGTSVKQERDNLDESLEDQDEPNQKAETKPRKTMFELNQPKAKNEELEKRTIFIGNIPKELSKDPRARHLKMLFKSFGTIETIRYRGVTAAKPTMLKKVALYKHEIHPNRSNVNAYIRFSSREEAELAAKECNGMVIQDHHLIVDLADNTNAKQDNKKTVFIGNLQLSTKEEELWTFFSDCGAIHSVRIVRDQSSGLGKGFGYVNFQNADSVELALTKNEEIFNCRPLRVSRAVKKLKQKKNESESMKTSNVRNNSKTKGKKQKGPRSSEGINNKDFAGDRISEIGALKRNAKKVNKGELKKARIAKQLLGSNQSHKDKKYSNSKNKPQSPKWQDVKGKVKKIYSQARKLHSKERGSKFKKQNLSKPGPGGGGIADKKKVSIFKRYYEK